MKRMVCEICGSAQIKKENGVFVCKECGTEYSSEEAKNLLKEIGENNEPNSLDIQKPAKEQFVQKENDDDVGVIKNQDQLKLKYELYSWHNFYEKFLFFMEISINGISCFGLFPANSSNS